MCAVVRTQVCTEDVLPCTGLLHQHQTPRGAVQKCNKGEPVGGSGGWGGGWGMLGSHVVAHLPVCCLHRGVEWVDPRYSCILCHCVVYAVGWDRLGNHVVPQLITMLSVQLLCTASSNESSSWHTTVLCLLPHSACRVHTVCM